MMGKELLRQMLLFAPFPQAISVNLHSVSRSGEDQIVAASQFREQMLGNALRRGRRVAILDSFDIAAQLQTQFVFAPPFNQPHRIRIFLSEVCARHSHVAKRCR